MLIIIWIIFAIMFFGLGIWHWVMAHKKVLHFIASERPTPPGVTFEFLVMSTDIDKPIKDFVRDFNNYIDTYNQTTKYVNNIQAVGYWIACATSILSGVLTVVY